ncbi:MAG: glycoside hydrolase family 16 protein [Planctomycetota bacterium]
MRWSPMLCCAAVALAAPIALGQNLLMNEGFESSIVPGGGPGSNPGQWVAFFGGTAGVTLEAFSDSSPVGGPARSGSAALRLSHTTTSGLGYGAFAGVAQRVDGVIPGEQYTFAIWVRDDTVALNGGVELRIEWVDQNGSFVGNPQQNTKEISGELLTSQYKEFAVIDTAPAGAVGLNAVIAIQSFTNDGVNPAAIVLAVDDTSVTSDVQPSNGLVLLVDEFDGTSLDTSLWFQPTGAGTFLGRTQIRPPSLPIEVSGGVARLYLDTFNPTGFSFFGSEIRTLEVFDLQDGLVFETRSRLLAGTPGGILGSLFSYVTNGTVRDEIDFEILSNDIPGSSDRILTNVFVDDDFSQGGDSAFVTPPGHDITEFNDYRIEWRPDRIDWYINDVLVRTETTSVPDGIVSGTVTDPLRIHLNVWAPDEFFGVAYNASLQPVASALLNQQYTYEVDRVEIRRIGCSAADIAADFGVLDDLDVVEAVLRVDASEMSGDFDENGATDFLDLSTYLNIFEVGCVP